MRALALISEADNSKANPTNDNNAAIAYVMKFAGAFGRLYALGVFSVAASLTVLF